MREGLGEAVTPRDAEVPGEGVGLADGSTLGSTRTRSTSHWPSQSAARTSAWPAAKSPAAIPGRLYEALAVEGGSSWFATRRLTLPLMAPIVLVLAVRDVVVVVQNAFVPALLVTEGGPANATTTAPLHLYVRAFEYGELGYASTLSVTLLALTAVAAALPLWLAARLAGRQRTRA